MVEIPIDRWSAAGRGASAPIRIVIADDHALVRAGLRALLAREPGMEVLGEVGEGRGAVAMVLELRPHVVLMDLAMTGLNGIEATRQIVAAGSRTRVLCMSMHDDEQFVGAAFQAGAAGYLLKDSPPDDLVRGIREVMAGHTFLSPAVAGKVVRGFAAQASGPLTSPFSLLTDREREVLQLIAEGQQPKQIAAMLGLSVKTVASHRERIQHKLDVHGVAGLTRYALSQGLVAPAQAKER